MTTAEFERRWDAAHRYAYGPGLRPWSPELVGFGMMLAFVWLGEQRVPEPVGIAGMVVFMGSSIASMVVNARRAPRAPAEFGLLCAGCGSSLIGGPHDERTAHVRQSGCCQWCRAAVLDDHAGAREAAARDAVLAQAPPHPSALARDDFDRRYAAYGQAMGRMRRLFLLVVAAGPPALVGAMFLPVDGPVRLRILQIGALAGVAVILWTVLGTRPVARRLGIECPACRTVPLGSLDISVKRTGVCPHCSAVMVLPGG